MADCYDDLMNLDLNLVPVAPRTPSVGPGTEPSSEEPVGLVRPRLHVVHRIRQALRARSQQLPLEAPRIPSVGPRTEPSSDESVGLDRRRPQVRNVLRIRRREMHSRSRELLLEAHSVDSNGIRSDPGAGSGMGFGGDVGDGGGTSQVGEGSVSNEGMSREVSKMCENNVISLESASLEGKEDVEKSSSESGSFFDCNICMEMSRDPVVTCCGHLFCWPCIYRWVYVHSDAKECPVCKGEVTLKGITPIYGRGTHPLEPEEDFGVKIPPRPSPGRDESMTQTIRRTSQSLASLSRMEEVIRRLGARFDPIPDIFQLRNVEGDSDSNSNSHSNSRAAILNRMMTTRARQREQDVADLVTTRDTIPNRTVTPNDLLDSEVTRLPFPNRTMALNDVVDLTQEEPEELPRRLPPLSNIRTQSLRSGTSASRAYIEACLRREERDFLSGNAAAESDSHVSLSASSSRRSELDSEDSRALRRRRLE